MTEKEGKDLTGLVILTEGYTEGDFDGDIQSLGFTEGDFDGDIESVGVTEGNIDGDIESVGVTEGCSEMVGVTDGTLEGELERAVQTESAGVASNFPASDSANIRSLSSSAFRSVSMFPSAPSTQWDVDVLDSSTSIDAENNISTRSLSSTGNNVMRVRNDETTSTMDIDLTNDNDQNANRNASDLPEDHQRRARSRWVLINRRFQMIITFVALLFSILLFSIL